MAAESGAEGKAGMSDVLGSEWAKLRTLRSFPYTLLAALVLGVGTALLMARLAAQAYADPAFCRRPDFDPAGVCLLGGCLLAQLAVGALGVLAVTSEYASGMIHTTLTVVPRRTRLLAAKTLVVSSIALVFGEAVEFTAFQVGQSVLESYGAPHTSLDRPHVLGAVVGTGLYLALTGPLGVALGFLARSTAGGLVALAAVTIPVPLLLVPLLPPGARRLWPGAGLQITALPGTAGPPIWLGLGTTCAAVAGTLLAAHTALRRRDA